MVSLGLDSKDFNKGLGEAEKSGGKFKKGMGTVGKAVAGVTAAAAGLTAAAFAATKKVTEGFDNIAKSSTKLGVSTDAYQEMDYWAGQNGISSQTMERAVGRLNQRIGLAADGNEKYSSALQNLGVDMEGVRDGTLSTEDAMAQSIQALSEMSSESEKSAAASELFGTKMARDLMPALQDGSLSLEEAAQKAKELGIVIDGDTLSAAEDFQDTWDDLSRSFSAVGQQIFAQLMPAFQAFMEWVLENLPAIRESFQFVFDFIGQIINTATEWFQSLIAWLDEWRDSNSEVLGDVWAAFEQYLGFIIEYWSYVFETAWEIIQEVFGFIVEFVSEVLSHIVEFWKDNGDEILETARNIFETVKEIVDTVFSTIFEIIQDLLGKASEFIGKTLEKIREFWDENGEGIMNIVETVFGVIQDIIETVMPIVQGIIEVAWDVITTIFDHALNVIMGFIEIFIGLFTGDFEKMKDGVVRIIESMWEGIKNLFSAAWDLISGPLVDLWDMLTGWFDDLANMALDWGKNMISGFIDGIKSMAGSVGDAAKNVVSGIGDFLKFWSPAKKGEGRFITQWGENMIDGFLDGVKNEASEAGRVMNELLGMMNPQENLDLRALLPKGEMNELVSRFPSTRIPKGNGGSNGSNSNITTNVLNTEKLEQLILELIQSVREGKTMRVGEREFAQLVGDFAEEEGGIRVRNHERGLA